MERVKTGIIGCGKGAHLHAQALKNLPESLFTAVYSRNFEKAKAFAEQYGVKACSSIEEMASQAGVEAALICTPHPAHAETAVKASKAGMHVLVEKPLASSLEDCDAIINSAKDNGVKLGTICQRRFYPPSLRIKAAIDAGKIGKPILGTVNMLGWRDEAYYQSDPWRGSWKGEGGGVLVNQAPHQLDLFQWYMGPVEEVFGYWSNLNHPYIEVEDTAIAVIRFKNGGSSITEPPLNDLWTVKGEEAMLEVWKREDTEFFNKINPMVYFHERQIEDFLRAVINGTQPLIDGAEGRKTVEIFTAIYRSNRDRMPIKFPLKPENKADFDGRLK